MRPADIASTLLAFALFVFAFTLAGTAFARSADASPSTPDNFRATLHDKADGELFRQREPIALALPTRSAATDRSSA